MAKKHKAKKKNLQAIIPSQPQRSTHIVTDSNKKIITELQSLSADQRSVVNSLLKAIDEKNVKESVAQITKIETVGLRQATLARFSSISLGQIFKIFREKWKSLPLQFTHKYSDYYDYIQQVFGYGYQMVDIYVIVWEAWFSGKYEFNIPEYVDIARLPVAKLRVAAPYIMQGTMTERRWKSLADETLTRSELSTILRSDLKKTKALTAQTIKKTATQKICTLVRETGDLRLYVNGQPEIVGHLNLDTENVFVLKEVRRILKEARIHIVK